LKPTSLTWNIENKGATTIVIIQGSLDETTRLDPLFTLKGPLTFDLSGIARINSHGVLKWEQFIHQLKDVKPIVFVRCSVAFMGPLNLLPTFCTNIAVKSFMAPYVCEATGEVQERLLEVAMLDPKNPPTFPCTGGILELDDSPQRYFAFLTRPKF